MVARTLSLEPKGRKLHSVLQVAQPAATLRMPFQETQEPQQVNNGGPVQPGHSILYYQPFSTTDLLNWRHHTPPYSEKPQAMIDLLESIFQTHRLTWGDIQQLLLTLFNSKERKQIITETRKWLQEEASEETIDVEEWAWNAAPDTRPEWNSNSQAEREALRTYRRALLHGLQATAKKLTNVSTTTVMQKPDRSPMYYCERQFQSPQTC
nr:uncharacterized protein LOC116152322 [Camelus dromedarius]